MGNNLNILDNIKVQYSRWNSTRKRIADRILSDPTRCSFLSIREFANLANTTDVTVINFCKGLGYSSYSELRKELQSYVLEWANPSDRMRMIAKSQESAEGLYKTIYDSQRMGVDEAFRLNSVDKILQADDMIRNASRIFIASHNASRLATNYLSYRFSTFGLEMTSLDLAEEHQSMSRLTMQRGNNPLLISVASPPYGKTTIAVTKLAKDIGFKIISFSDDPSCPLYGLSDLAFICPNLQKFGGLTNSYVPYFALFDALAFFYYFGHEKEGKESEVKHLKSAYSEILNDL